MPSLLFLSQWYIIYFISTGPGSIRFSLSFSVSPLFSLSLLRRSRERFRSVTLLDTDILSYPVRLATAARRDYVCPVFACTMTLESSDKGCTHTKDEWKQCDYEERERGRQKRGSRRWRDSQIATVGRLRPTCPGSYANVHAVSHFGKFKSELEGERQKERGGRSNRASRLRQISPHRNYSYSRRRRRREETGLFVADATDPTFPICDVNSRRWQWRVLFSLYTPSSTSILIFVFLLNVKDLHYMKSILNY